MHLAFGFCNVEAELVQIGNGHHPCVAVILAHASHQLYTNVVQDAGTRLHDMSCYCSNAGCSRSEWKQVEAFYSHWMAFVSCQEFSWADRYNPATAAVRKVPSLTSCQCPDSCIACMGSPPLLHCLFLDCQKSAERFRQYISLSMLNEPLGELRAPLIDD